MSEDKLPESHGSAGQHEVASHGDPFADPGLPAHEPRRTDIDERAAKRAERQVSLMFVVSMLATVGFIASYVAIDADKIVYIFPLGHVSALNFALGLTLGVALFCIGAGAVHWARTLMSDHELPAERHPIEADDEVRADVIEQFKTGAAESGFGRRKMIRNTLIGSMALVPLSGVVLLRDLGPLPEKKLQHTGWDLATPEHPLPLVNMNTNKPMKAEDIVVGSLTFAKPEGLEEDDETFQQQIAKDALMLVRIAPENIKDKDSAELGFEGILAYSKICTHVGCPISLYEQQTHHALCPCHQSTFDLADGARVIFGPAGHPLPQLKITTNEEGFLVATGDFAEPVGPSFWERS
ncbi:ubiquinol-cytochrome c reductase iron-sulfur subunit [Kitasatospora herbaricolor]|uniref:Cytochrome bc1 complex Rieske iron-sulfur subunit n=1 Tax=Kitasatospora herbaricolor TaxID=68217 RepID=A0ABZ1WEW3_9ACTN|nr:Rieske 2Fe-2S domain-containing protein [Kitasatospora herbaricolor]MDQ0307879.1 ubiquinol-cytochrome c reductase iron-sulfur subunit [Kitasatospora herbaricolor]